MEGDKAGKSGASSSGDIFDAHAFDLDITLGQVLGCAGILCVCVLEICSWFTEHNSPEKLMKKDQYFFEIIRIT